MAPGDGNCPEARGPDFDFGSSPILVRLANGKRALIAGQKSGVVYALTLIGRAPSCGNVASARVASRAGCNGALPPTIATSTTSICHLTAD